MSSYRGETMFSKISRYKKLTGIVTIDARGRLLESKSIRLLPDVSGTFLHTVEEVDRLDHLAFKYYKQPRKWWRICDANPEFMSPLALLGKDTVVTTRFPVSFNQNTEQPPWHELINRLSRQTGVKDVSLEETTQLVKETIEHEYEGEPKEVEVHTETFQRVVTVIYNRLNVTAADLKKIFEDQKFTVGEPADIGRLGKKSIIPPNVVG